MRNLVVIWPSGHRPSRKIPRLDSTVTALRKFCFRSPPPIPDRSSISVGNGAPSDPLRCPRAKHLEASNNSAFRSTRPEFAQFVFHGADLGCVEVCPGRDCRAAWDFMRVRIVSAAKNSTCFASLARRPGLSLRSRFSHVRIFPLWTKADRRAARRVLKRYRSIPSAEPAGLAVLHASEQGPLRWGLRPLRR
jgi:hypothetical protein